MAKQWLAGWLVCLICCSSVEAGLHCSLETVNSLPSQWRGFLLDHRTLRLISRPGNDKAADNFQRNRYQAELKRLEEEGKTRKLTPEEWADVGALHLRLGETGKGLAILQKANQDYPRHYRIVTNLGTAWQMQGDLNQAALLLAEGVKLAPGKLQKAEQLHLDLVKKRLQTKNTPPDLDNLLGVQWTGPDGKYQPGRLADRERNKIPDDTVANLQLLALWLPDDPFLLWQLAEVVNAQGDISTAAAMMDGCVTEFGLRSPQLREHRQLLRAEADKLSQETKNRENHDTKHTLLFQPKSTRPLVSKLDKEGLPPIDSAGINTLAWPVLTETIIDRPFKPRFSQYLEQLAGKKVEMRGYMQPIGEETDCPAFLLIEFPIGCWYCEMPELTAMVRVELPGDGTQPFTRSRILVTGELSLNTKDPERFLYTIKSAKIVEMENR